MIETKTKIKAGLLVIVCGIIFFLSYSWLTDFKFRKKKYHYGASFPQVGWVKVGDIVTVLGVPKGRVEGIKLFPDSVVIEFYIEDYPLREGARAWIESLGIIGQMRMGVSLGKGAILPEKSIIKGETKRSLSDLVSSVANIMSRSDSLLLEGFRILSKASTKLERVSGELTGFFHTLDSLAVDIRLLARETRGELKTSLTKADSLLTSMNKISEMIMKGEGSLGKFLRERRLYEQADSTLRALRSLIQDIKRNPKKYFKIEIF